MASSTAATVDEYLNELPPERRAVVAAVREAVLGHLPDGYVESMNWGMISYEIPLADYPDTYNGKPLVYAGLAAQKRHYALYLMGLYVDPAQEEKLRAAYAQQGKKIDLGKSCLRFRKLEDVPLEVVGEIVASMPVDEYIARYETGQTRSTTKG